MGESLFVSLVVVCFAGYFLARNIELYQHEEKLIQYLEKSTKAKFWIIKLGMPKTILLSKKIFLPLGILISCLLLVMSFYSIISLL